MRMMNDNNNVDFDFWKALQSNWSKIIVTQTQKHTCPQFFLYMYTMYETETDLNWKMNIKITITM